MMSKKKCEKNSQPAGSYCNHHGNEEEDSGSGLLHGEDGATFMSQLLIRENLMMMP